MRAVLTNFGTTGDIQPFLALAVELQRNGHAPLLALSPIFAARARQLGLEFVAIGPDLEQVQRDVNIAMMEMADSEEELSKLLIPLASALPGAVYELQDVCRGAEVLISGSAQPAGRMVHEITGIPFVSVQLYQFGGAGPSSLQRSSASLINPVRARFGLPPLRNPVTVDANSSQLTLYALSRHIRPPQSDWPSHYKVTGFFFLEEEHETPDSALVEFMRAGEPPVVFTFGSMAHHDPEALTDILLDTIRRVGRRAIIQQGWSGLARRRLPADVQSAGFMPHTWLFQNAACVVHHGGAGTTAAAFRAGVPQVLVPHMADQPIWADIARALDCAGPPVPYLQLTAQALGSAVETTLATPGYFQAAAAFGMKVRAEPGVKKARQLIEQLVAQIGPAAAAAEAARPLGKPVVERTVRRRQYQQSRLLKKR